MHLNMKEGAERDKEINHMLPYIYFHDYFSVCTCSTKEI